MRCDVTFFFVRRTFLPCTANECRLLKKRPNVAMEPETSSNAPAFTDDEVLELLSLGNLKRKKSSKKKKDKDKDKERKPAAAPAPLSESQIQGPDVFVEGEQLHQMYSYEHMLDRIFTALENAPELKTNAHRSRPKIPEFDLTRHGKMTIWTNFMAVCTAMRRDPQHVMSFFNAELAVKGSLDGTRRLSMKGRFSANVLQSIVRKYMLEYVTCSVCNSAYTQMEKDRSIKAHVVLCGDCHAERIVAPITQGYVAVDRETRRLAKEAAGNV